MRFIDTSRSRWGWSREAADAKCAQAGAFADVLHIDETTLDPDAAAPLLRGTLGHVGIAHRNWRIRARQRNENPDEVYAPEDAMQRFALAYPLHLPFLDIILKTYEAYCRKYPKPPGEFLIVEEEVVGILGWHRTAQNAKAEWGLWLLRQDAADALTGEETSAAGDMPAYHGGIITPTYADVPNHERHGKVMPLSRRWDFVVRNPITQRVVVFDAKFTAADSGHSRLESYAPDGQFHANNILARQLYRDQYDCMYLDLIHVEDIKKSKRGEVPVAPYRVATFPHQLYERRHTRWRRQVQKMDPWLYPRADEETVCKGRYGFCKFRALCDYGPDYLRLKMQHHG